MEVIESAPGWFVLLDPSGRVLMGDTDPDPLLALAGILD